LPLSILPERVTPVCEREAPTALGIHLPGFLREVMKVFWSLPPVSEDGHANDLIAVSDRVLDRYLSAKALENQPETMTMDLFHDLYFSTRLVGFDEEGFIEHMKEESASGIDERGVFHAVLHWFIRQILIDGWGEEDGEEGKIKREDARRRELGRAEEARRRADRLR
jgi:hypothetical protein